MNFFCAKVDKAALSSVWPQQSVDRVFRNGKGKPVHGVLALVGFGSIFSGQYHVLHRHVSFR